ncbi:MAG: hypothetical protein IMW98_06220 [Firmicutes bacterium]|nr:hypothetical protein [Bacillota bacterium]
MDDTYMAEDEIDLRQYLAVLSKWRWVIVVITGVAILSAAVLSYAVLPKVYQSDVTLMVNRAAPSTPTYQSQQPTNLNTIVDPLAQLPQMTINGYIAQITSPVLMQTVIRNLHLDAQGFTVESLNQALRVENPQNTNLIEIHVQDTDPIRARKIAEAVTAAFLDQIQKNNEEQLSQSTTYLTSQAKEVKKQLDQAVAQLQALQADPHSASLVKQELDTRMQQLHDYRNTLLEAQVALQAALARKESIDRQLAATPPTQTVESTTMGTDANGNPKPLKTTAVQPNPAYTALQQEADQAGADIAQYQAQIETLTATVQSLTSEVADLQKQLAERQTKEDAAQEQVDQLKSTYELLQQKITETQIVKASDLGATDVLPVSPARTPEAPIKPRPVLNMAVAAVLGLMVSVLAVFWLEMIDNTIKTPLDVQRWVGLPVLGTLPRAGE